jgi:tripartite-type tricarboxylate transporter receptor subunit TctC
MAASKRKSALLWISALLLLMAGAASAAADDYPSRPIKIVVPFAAGGGNDLLARLIGQELSANLRQPVIIENRPGAGTQIGAEAVAHAAPDGYTLLSTSLTTYALNPNLYKKLPYDPARDFAPVALTGRFELLLVANPSFPAASLADLLALARAKPNAISFASSGPASPHQMAMELLLHRAGVEMVHIAYKGAAPAVQDVIAGHVPIMMLDVATGREPIKSGLLKALASASPARFSRLSRAADDRRARVSRLRGVCLAGHCRAGQDTCSNHRQAQRADRRGAGKARHATEIAHGGHRAAHELTGELCRIYA